MIVVILPSKNESDNIVNITRVVDTGLAEYFPEMSAIILNVDSCSTDGTANLFAGCNTVTPKKQIILPPKYMGKGYNLKAGIEHALSLNAQCIITLDTDVRSAEPIWVSKMANGVLTGDHHLMVPIYKRNRYEGNTTNHFSSPIIYACWGRDIQQPIGGDFAISPTLARHFIDGFKIAEDFQYGVDTLLTWTALAHNLEVGQTQLGRKIHNPSFGKIVNMFQQVAATTFRQVILHQDKIRPRLTAMMKLSSAGNEGAGCDAIDHLFVKRPEESSLAQLEQTAISLLKMAGQEQLPISPMNMNCWISFLSQTIVRALCSNWVPEQIRSELSLVSAYYFLRVAHYIREIDSKSPLEISETLVDMKSKLRNSLLLDFSSSHDAISGSSKGDLHDQCS